MQTPSQHQIIAKLIQRRCSINKHSRCNKNRQTVDSVVPGVDSAKDVAGDKEEGGPGVDPGYAPRLVAEGLIGVQGAGEEKEDCEGDGCAVVGGVPVEGAFDWWLLASFSDEVSRFVLLTSVTVFRHFDELNGNLNEKALL